jgi:hypothetical protein
MSDEGQAMLTIAEKLDRKALGIAQTAARVALRAQAKRVIDRLKGDIADERAALKIAIHASNEAIDEHFANARIDALRAGTIPARIAAVDASKLSGAPDVRIHRGEFRQVQQTSTILKGTQPEAQESL